MNTYGMPSWFGALLFLGITLLIFLALRAIVLWYWKIDKIVGNQQKQIDLLNELVNKNRI